jgi:phage-related minor tail protein
MTDLNTLLTVLDLNSFKELSTMGAGLFALALVIFYFIPKAEKKELAFKLERETSAENFKQERIAIVKKYENTIAGLIDKFEKDRAETTIKIEKMYEQVFEVTRQYSMEIKHLTKAIDKQGDQIIKFNELIDPINREVVVLSQSNKMLTEIMAKTKRADEILQQLLDDKNKPQKA